MEPPSSPKFADVPPAKDRGALAELCALLRHNKKYWMLPIVVLLFLFGALIVISGSSAAPFIYTLF